MILFWIALVLYILYLSSATNTSEYNSEIPREEFFWGIKKDREERIFVFVQFARRIYYVIILVFYPSTSAWGLILMLITFQLIYLLFLIYLRPFEEMKGNVIEIMNEAVFLSLLFSHFFLNSEDNWNSSLSKLYFSIIVINIIAMFIITNSKHVFIFVYTSAQIIIWNIFIIKAK